MEEKREKSLGERNGNREYSSSTIYVNEKNMKKYYFDRKKM